MRADTSAPAAIDHHGPAKYGGEGAGVARPLVFRSGRSLAVFAAQRHSAHEVTAAREAVGRTYAGAGNHIGSGGGRGWAVLHLHATRYGGGESVSGRAHKAYGGSNGDESRSRAPEPCLAGEEHAAIRFVQQRLAN